MKAKILIVGDDMYLRVFNYEPICAKNFIAAKSFFGTDTFDLVILDVMLPDVNGLDLCSFIRSTGADIPILFLTACDEEFHIVRGIDAGADDYVPNRSDFLNFFPVSAYFYAVRLQTPPISSMILPSTWQVFSFII